MIAKFDVIKNKSADDIFKEDVKIANFECVRNELSKPTYKKGGETGVLLVHGFCASPQEMLTLHEELARRGFSVYSARVAGHGTSVSDLISKTYIDWYNSLIYGYSTLKAACKRVIVIGQSNGGLLASAVALNNDVAALGLLAPAFKVHILGFPLVKYLQYVIKGFPRNLTDEEKPYNYNMFPSKPLYNMMILQKYIGDRIINIDVPVLTAISENDILVSPKTAIKMLEKMKSSDKTLKLYDNKKFDVRHILTEKHSVKIVGEVADWVERV